MASPPQPMPISGVLQHYAWGGYDFIPDLLGRQNPDKQPTAELWLGAHPRGAAKIIGSAQNLAEAIAANPKGMLGEEVAERFNNRLPFLFKILDVREMLSIQVHPSKAAAEAGYAREEAAGIDPAAPHRNYRDNNHKPELGVAITDFYLLHGFKPRKNILRLLRVIPGWDDLIPVLEERGVAGLYAYVMSVDQPTVNRLAQEALDSLDLISDDSKEGMAYWTRQAVEKYSKGGHHDRGMFSLWWMNIVHLHPGEAIFQDAGVPHAYLEGVCLEVMANSDNVLRGGLTPKHIDVKELLEHTVTRAIKPRLLLPNISPDNWERYPTPTPDFALYRAELHLGEDLAIDTTEGGPVILFLLSGKLASPSIALTERRRAVFIPAGQIINFLAYEKGTVVFRAGTGIRETFPVAGAGAGHHISDR